MTRTRWIAAAAAVVFALLAACSSKEPDARPTPGASTPPATPPTQTATPGARFDLDSLRIGLDRITTGLSRPLFLTHAGDGTGRMYVLEQDGRIVLLERSGDVRGTFLDIRARVNASGNEQGLLGLAFHPDYDSNGRFFIYYTERDGNAQVLSEFRRRSATSADPGSERVLLRMADQFSNHNGGWLGFGPDGFLYVSTGDGGGGGDTLGSGQNLGTLLAKILRLDVNEAGRYRIPPGNPFASRSGARDEIWVTGLRNPWRASFDRETGDLFIGDVGQVSREELDVVPASTKGQNFGWNTMEGSECFGASGCSRSGLELPVAEYPTAEGCAITGGYVYRGQQHPSLIGGYFFGDFCNGRVYAVDASRAVRGRVAERTLLDTELQITSFGEDEAGEIYVVGRGGTIHHLVAG